MMWLYDYDFTQLALLMAELAKADSEIRSNAHLLYLACLTHKVF